MIEDLDGGDTSPSRAPIVRAISVALVVAAAIGWAALQQPALRGPYATPDPRGGVVFSAPRVIPVTAISPDGCLQILQIRTAVGFVGDTPATLIRPFPAPPPDAQTYVFTNNGATLIGRTCQPEIPTPAWRFAP